MPGVSGAADRAAAQHAPGGEQRRRPAATSAAAPGTDRGAGAQPEDRGRQRSSAPSSAEQRAQPTGATRGGPTHGSPASPRLPPAACPRSRSPRPSASTRWSSLCAGSRCAVRKPVDALVDVPDEQARRRAASRRRPRAAGSRAGSTPAGCPGAAGMRTTRGARVDGRQRARRGVVCVDRLDVDPAELAPSTRRRDAAAGRRGRATCPAPSAPTRRCPRASRRPARRARAGPSRWPNS